MTTMPKTTPKTMRAIAMDHFGGLDTLALQTLPVPEVGPDEVLIHVASAGVGVWDPFEREGGFAEMLGGKPRFPYVLGSEGAGTIADIGSRVSRFKPGDQVYATALANPKGGFYAEYIVVSAEQASFIPGGLTVEQAGVMPVDAMTALQGLDDALGLKQSETLLVFGASGGIGHLAVQLARRMGARVLAVASGEDGVALVQQLGADAVVDGHADDVAAAARAFAPDGLDAALLTAGGKAAEKALMAVRDGGRVAYPNGVEPEPRGRSGLNVQSYDGMPDAQTIEKLNRLIETPVGGSGGGTSGAGGSGGFEVHIARTFALEQAAEAHRALETHFLGKLALRPA